jgi:hypothetical protein
VAETVCNYIEWLLNLEEVLKKDNIELSSYDEFYINDAINTIEQILISQPNNEVTFLDENMIDAYMSNAIKLDPSKKDYYETISYYVKRRLPTVTRK